MPRYEFMSEKCKKRFEVLLAISEREKATVTYPKCKGAKVVPQLGGFMAQTAKKSLTRELARLFPDSGA